MRFTPEQIQHAEDHRVSIFNRDSVMNSTRLGCFYCGEIFTPGDQGESDWCDHGETALCPFCGVDSVIGDESGLPITKEFLEAAHNAWFGDGTCC